MNNLFPCYSDMRQHLLSFANPNNPWEMCQVHRLLVLVDFIAKWFYYSFTPNFLYTLNNYSLLGSRLKKCNKMFCPYPFNIYMWTCLEENIPLFITFYVSLHQCSERVKETNLGFYLCCHQILCLAVSRGFAIAL